MIIFTIIFILLDIGSKLIVSKYLFINQSIPVIKNFMNITHVKNTGVAWNLFDNQTILILIISVIVIIGFIIYIYKNKPSNLIDKIAYSMIIGGAIGNFVNRLTYGYVTDFIDISLFGYNYPIFNLADSFIVLGVIILIISSLRGDYDRNKSNH